MFCPARVRGWRLLWSQLFGGVPAAFGLLAVATAVEFVAPIERHSLRSRLFGLQVWVAGTALGIGSIVLLQTATRTLGVKPLVTIPLSPEATPWWILALAASLLFSDFLAYWQHRFQHRFLWPVHAVHHSPTSLNAVNGYAHFLEKTFQYFLIGLPLTVVNFDWPGTPFVLVAILEMLQHYIHSPIDAGLGPLNRIVVDNRFHRIHHSLEPKHFDRNFGILFSFWDRLFGTAYQPEPGEWPAVGVVDYPPPRHLVEYALYPLRFRRRQSVDNLPSPTAHAN